MDSEKSRLLERGKRKKPPKSPNLNTSNEQNQPTEESDNFDITSTSFDAIVPKRTWKTFLILILTPLLLCPIPLSLKSADSKAGYGILIMVIYWVTEVTPLAVTSTLPFFMFPMLGVLTSTEAAASYLTDANVLFLGGLLVFVAFEEWNLHKRIALKTLLLMGTKRQNLVFGFMLTTAFISTLLSNTATTVMMVQIVKVILSEVEKTESVMADREEDSLAANNFLETQTDNEETAFYTQNPHIATNADEVTTESRDVRNKVDEKQKQQNIMFGKVLMLAIAFSANIGGIATLTGTGTNMIFAGQAKKIFPGSGGVSFAEWFGFAFPLMIVLLLISWVYLVIMFLGWRSLFNCFRRKTANESKLIANIIRHEYEALGKMSFAEIAVLVHLVVLVILWLTKEPQFIPGWNSIFLKGYVSDGAVAMLVAFSLFQFPSRRPNIFCWSRPKNTQKGARTLLNLNIVSDKLCWNVLVLLGSGFAIAAACEKSGLSEVFSRKLLALKGISHYVIVTVACVAVTFITEILSNTGTATIFLPVLASLAVSLHIHPWLLMIPATIACSFAFMFPISTPANAIVYSTGRLKMLDMVKAGFGMDLICLAILLAFIFTYGNFYYHLKTFPSWARDPGLFSTMKPLNTTQLNQLI